MSNSTKTAKHQGRALVTGCAGFIGSHLTERLLADGHEVVGVDCFTDYYAREVKQANLARALETPGFTLRTLDLAEDALVDLLDGVDVVYHLAAQPGVRTSFAGFDVYVRNNVLATQRLLEAASHRELEAFVYASSSSVYGDAGEIPTHESVPLAPLSPYGATKVATEDVAQLYHRASGVPVVGLRFFTVYGPRQRPDMAFSRFIAQARRGEPIVINGDGRQWRDFTYVGDVVDGIIAARRGEPGAAYNVGGGTPAQLLDVVRLMEELTGWSIAVEHNSPQRGDARRTCADGSRARRDLDFAPRTRLAEGLAAQLEHALRGREQADRLAA